MIMPWYLFTPSFIRNPFDPNQYTLVTGLPPLCSGANRFTCAIQANDNLGQPIITFGTGVDIVWALLWRRDTVVVKLKPTP